MIHMGLRVQRSYCHDVCKRKGRGNMIGSSHETQPVRDRLVENRRMCLIVTQPEVLFLSVLHVNQKRNK